MRTLFAAIFLFLLPLTTLAQDNDCSVIQTALTTAEESCSDIGSKEICLGHAKVEVVFNTDTPPVFESLGDTAPLDVTCHVRSSARLSSGDWGMAVMTIRPTDTDRDVTYVLVGDVEMQNVCTRSLRQTAIATSDIDIYSQPGPPYDSIKHIVVGEAIEVNACNCTGHWLRTVLDDGRVGWLLARNVQIAEATDALPVVTANTPVYAPMQAFTLHSGQTETTCTNAPPDGLLIQVPTGLTAVPLQINGIEVLAAATVFAQSQPGAALKIMVLEGVAQVSANQFTVSAPAGTSVLVPLSAENQSLDGTTVIPFAAQDVAHVPFDLLPHAVELETGLSNPTPQIVGLQTCNVVSDRGAALCPLYFVNPDGDALTRLDVKFLHAPQGDWVGSVIEAPQIIVGDTFSGQVAWMPSCTLGAANFIGPVKWAITLTDEQGHTSPAFEASFNCTDG